MTNPPAMVLAVFLAMATADQPFSIIPRLEETRLHGPDEIVYLAAYPLQVEGLADQRALVS